MYVGVCVLGCVCVFSVHVELGYGRRHFTFLCLAFSSSSCDAASCDDGGCLSGEKQWGGGGSVCVCFYVYAAVSLGVERKKRTEGSGMQALCPCAFCLSALCER